MITLILALVVFGGMAGPGPASAASIGCGQCHSNPPADTDNTCPKLVSNNHPAHSNGADLTTCDRCHPTVASPGHPSAVHINGLINVTSTVSPGMRYTSGTQTCTGACHKNRDAKWNGQVDCNACHYRSGPLGNVAPSGLHATSDRSWKHYSSPIKVINNTKSISCAYNLGGCHPNNESDTAVPKAHIGSANFIKRADMSEAHTYVNVSGVGYTKGATPTDGTCAKSCHYNPTDPFGNRTIYFKAGQTKMFGAYQTAKWGDNDLKCNECHSTPSQEATFRSITSGGYGVDVTASDNANNRHSAHLFKYKLNVYNFASEDRNIYCDDCHRTPDINSVRGFRQHSTVGEGGSGVISLPVKSQNTRVYLKARNNGIGRDKVNPASFNQAQGSCSNVYCHTIMTTGKWTEDACDKCHGTKDGVDVGSGAPGYINWTSSGTYRPFEEYSGCGGAHYSHVVKRGYACRTCHYDGGGDGNPANHNQGNGVVLRANVNVGVHPNYWFNNKTSYYDRTTRSCNNVRCHYGSSQNWDCNPIH